MKRYYILFKGQVQGVGFRFTAEMIARKYNLTGWVRNLYDGDVEMEVQGDEMAIHNMIRELYNSSRWIRIENHFMKEKPLRDDEHGFHSVYGSMDSYY